MDFVFTETFHSVYRSLSDDEVAPIDQAIRRLLLEHRHAWARQGRIEGESGNAWILPVRTRSLDAAMYWDYQSEGVIVLLALVVRRA